MIVEFFDLHDRTNPLNGATVTTEVELSSLVEGLRSRLPFFCELIGENGFQLWWVLVTMLDAFSTAPVTTTRPI